MCLIREETRGSCLVLVYRPGNCFLPANQQPCEGLDAGWWVILLIRRCDESGRVDAWCSIQIVSRVRHDDFHVISAAESVLTSWELARGSYPRRLCSSFLYYRLDSCVNATDVNLTVVLLVVEENAC